ncbi:hypothetical protein [Terracoccus luteus]|nr:hypothetical protein [Terracoccus luteus]
MVTSSSTDAGGPAVEGRAAFAARGLGDVGVLVGLGALVVFGAVGQG